LVQYELQDTILRHILEYFNVPPAEASKIFYRWESSQKPLIKDFSPYAFYCMRATDLLLYGISYQFISTKSTNYIDLEYLYYLPFCMVFASNDKDTHGKLAPLLLDKEQYFLSGFTLKDDLRAIAKEWRGCDISNIPYFKKEGSITAALWEKFMEFPITNRKSNLVNELSPERLEEIRRQVMDQVENSQDVSGKSSDINVDAADFVIRKRTIQITEPCPCGSGSFYTDCCLKK